MGDMRLGWNGWGGGLLRLPLRAIMFNWTNSKVLNNQAVHIHERKKWVKFTRLGFH